jgi:hypothetical protein
MTDENLRALERAALTGCAVALGRLEAARVRAGRFDEQELARFDKRVRLLLARANGPEHRRLAPEHRRPARLAVVVVADAVRGASAREPGASHPDVHILDRYAFDLVPDDRIMLVCERARNASGSIDLVCVGIARVGLSVPGAAEDVSVSVGRVWPSLAACVRRVTHEQLVEHRSGLVRAWVLRPATGPAKRASTAARNGAEWASRVLAGELPGDAP